jgi:hypothetical protein
VIRVFLVSFAQTRTEPLPDPRGFMRSSSGAAAGT